MNRKKKDNNAKEEKRKKKVGKSESRSKGMKVRIKT